MLAGRMVAVQPDTQMVEPMVACVTAGFSAPGVRRRSGSPGSRSAAEPDTGNLIGTPVGPGMVEAPGEESTAPSSSASASVGLGAAASGEGETVSVTAGVTCGLSASWPPMIAPISLGEAID